MKVALGLVLLLCAAVAWAATRRPWRWEEPPIIDEVEGLFV